MVLDVGGRTRAGKSTRSKGECEGWIKVRRFGKKVQIVLARKSGSEVDDVHRGSELGAWCEWWRGGGLVGTEASPGARCDARERKRQNPQRTDAVLS